MPDERSRPVLAYRAGGSDRTGLRGGKAREAHSSRLTSACKAALRRPLAGARHESP